MVSLILKSIQALSWAITLFCVTLFASNSVYAAREITASVDQNPVLLGSSFILEITANEGLDASDWDNSALLKDFVVGRTSTQSQTSYSNGSLTRSTTLTTLLVANKTGVFIIPAFDFDGIKTRPIKISVIEPSQQNTSSNNLTNNLSQQNVELKNTLSTETIYVGQQFIYTSKLYIAQNTEMQSGNLISPEADNATVKQIGKDTNKNVIVNGRKYQTITRRYAITINQPGNVAITPSRFEGQISSYRSGYRFATSKPVIIQGKVKTVNVKAIPSDYQGNWLVSDFVQLSEEWQSTAGDTTANDYKQGEPITRTITLTAAKVNKTALPDIAISWPDSVKVYPDKPQLTSFAQQGSYFAQQVISYAIIPNESGQITLPEIKVPWFNPSTQKQEWASLPAKILNITANEAVTTPAQVQPVITNNTQTITTSPKAPLWNWLTGLFAVLWVMTACAWWFQVKNTQPKTILTAQQNTTEGNAWPQLEKALKANDAKLAQQYLHLWFKQYWPELTHHNIDQLPVSQECKDACNALSSSIYSKNAQRWQGEQLLALLSTLRKKQKKADNSVVDSIAPQLNP